MAAIATFALKAGVWFRRGRLVIVSPDSLGTTCQLSGRNSTYRPVQISGTGSCLGARRGRQDARTGFVAASPMRLSGLGLPTAPTPSDAPRACYRVRPPPRSLPTDSATGLTPWGSLKPAVDCPLAVVGSSGSWRRAAQQAGPACLRQVVGV